MPNYSLSCTTPLNWWILQCARYSFFSIASHLRTSALAIPWLFNPDTSLPAGGRDSQRSQNNHNFPVEFFPFAAQKLRVPHAKCVSRRNFLHPWWCLGGLWGSQELMLSKINRSLGAALGFLMRSPWKLLQRLPMIFGFKSWSKSSNDHIFCILLM